MMDADATVRRRSALRAEHGWNAPPAFSFGDAREAYERRWTSALQDALHTTIAHYPALRRQVMHAHLEAAIDTELDAGKPIDPEDVAKILAALEAELSHSAR